MNYHSQPNKLFIFTRTPIKGKVKTRLQPIYTIGQSLFLHTYLLQRTIAEFQPCQNIDIEICCTPSYQHPVFSQYNTSFNISLSLQIGKDLGERMLNAMNYGLRDHNKVIIIGTDCYEINESYINKAFTALEKNDVVIGPAFDGGYVLIGMRRSINEVFDAIPWGTKHVLERTRNQLQRSSITWHELPTLRDIDNAEDLHYFPELLALLTNTNDRNKHELAG